MRQFLWFTVRTLGAQTIRWAQQTAEYVTIHVRRRKMTSKKKTNEVQRRTCSLCHQSINSWWIVCVERTFCTVIILNILVDARINLIVIVFNQRIEVRFEEKAKTITKPLPSSEKGTTISVTSASVQLIQSVAASDILGNLIW